MPFHREFSALGIDIVYDTGDYAGLLDEFLKRVGVADAARRYGPASASRRDGRPVIGLTCVVGRRVSH